MKASILNGKLGAAERMTREVLQDLLGVKSDMTNVAVCFEVYHNISFLIILKNPNSGEVHLSNNSVLNIFAESSWSSAGGAILYASSERFFGKGTAFCSISTHGSYVEICRHVRSGGR